MVLEAPGPRRVRVFWNSHFSTAWLVRTGSSYQWRGPFITVWRPSQRYEGLTVRDLGEEPRHDCTFQLSSSATPHPPPEVLQPLGRRVEQPPLRRCVHCHEIRSTHARNTELVQLPFQNLAISAISSSSVSTLSILPFSSFALITNPFGSIHAIFVATPRRPGPSADRSFFRGRQAYQERCRVSVMRSHGSCIQRARSDGGMERYEAVGRSG